MKKCLFLMLFYCSSITFSQIEIRGTVYEAKGVLEGAAVYFNNSMTGTTTNSEGEFTLKTKEGQYELVISYLGYKKIIYTLNTATYKKPLVFALEEESNTLDEIIIKKIVYDEAWKHNLSVFKREFLGTSMIAKECEIINPKVLSFDFDATNNILTATARAPLELKHKGLGYKIIFDLESFSFQKNRITYLGYSRYQLLKGSKRKQRRWRGNRATAYRGSFVHFYQSLLKNTTYADGFLIHQFKRLPNPERPSETEIEKARQLLRLSNRLKGVAINFSIKTTPKTALDSALIVLKKVKLPKFKDYLYKSKVPTNEVLTRKDGRVFLDFKNNLMIVYTKEFEEEAYIMRNTFSRKRKPLPQTSNIIPIEMPCAIDKNGLLLNPLNVFYEGYWAFEKFGNSLPVEYVLD